jgi:hypothetical protein
VTDEQFTRLRCWGGEAVNHLHSIADKPSYCGDKSRLRHIADQLHDILKELKLDRLNSGKEQT